MIVKARNIEQEGGQILGSFRVGPKGPKQPEIVGLPRGSLLAQ